MIRVLIVDDSATVQKMLSAELSKFSDIEVVGSAIDPYTARDKILRLRPDVLTLDIEMPRMDGLSFLTKLMKHYPMPVVVVSSLTLEDSEGALRALSLGALDVVPKPGSQYSVPEVERKLIRAIRTAAVSKVIHQPKAQPEENISRVSQPVSPNMAKKIIAIGASTGGTIAIERILKDFPMNSPGAVIVQHMPANFTGSFARRLNEMCQVEVREAEGGENIIPGVVFIAPGGRHMLLEKHGAVFRTRLKDGPPVHYQRPAVDILFHSVAMHAGRNAVGVLLTGMGSDGAKGLLAMRQNGAHTIVQDEMTSVVFGMPREAIKVKAALEIEPLGSIAGAIYKSLKSKRAA
ncbi:MAG: chemotaxis response regulator protein-glutamate methylesterase [Candidatus Eisenbacteria bacterium]|uniref:Protein-glutamate methylesterase/protein-glutamine glutaminase n=1 Tax=Eiseniibacteriota bacterium TaxID=2212470 RepID=A0A948RWB1_UNCEI|nr:chemotaxis response regulator protein-glutamate methylesterase [Candidatus Eisenbacteria bacterium]MBU1951143.1 chemotaxis response regulator protein-glutamate methylesterase [Candidatus Eisenbacteria bacterium]MBU2690192.1 chemotaxis response regulator protein-glutamate methylesterase [Candidatus Eisenbacteria bacterium]